MSCSHLSKEKRKISGIAAANNTNLQSDFFSCRVNEVKSIAGGGFHVIFHKCYKAVDRPKEELTIYDQLKEDNRYYHALVMDTIPKMGEVSTQHYISITYENYLKNTKGKKLSEEKFKIYILNRLYALFAVASAQKYFANFYGLYHFYNYEKILYLTRKEPTEEWKERFIDFLPNLLFN